MLDLVPSITKWHTYYMKLYFFMGENVKESYTNKHKMSTQKNGSKWTPAFQFCQKVIYDA